MTTSGRRIGATSAPSGPVHLPATIRNAAARRARPDHGASSPAAPARALHVRPADLRRSVLQGKESNLVLLCVDASGSMAARKRMEAVKSAVLSLLLDAYQRRDKVGLVTFRGDGAQLTLPPTGSVDVAARRLTDLAHGGRTPLAEGLLTAYDTLRVERLRDPHRRALLVVVTDGRATSGRDAVGRAATVAGHLRRDGVDAVVLDCEAGRFRLGLAARLADAARRRAPAGRRARGLRDRRRGAIRPRARLCRKESGLMQGQPTTVPDDGLTTRQRRNRPLVMVHTGNGKGKSTAAFGLALRGWNQGWSVGVFQFVKSAKWRIGEQTAVETLGDLHERTGLGGPMEWHKMGAGWSWARKEGSEADHAEAAREGWAEIKRRLAAQTHGLYVLDEFTYPMVWGWVDVDDVVSTLRDRPGHQHVVITGRRCPAEVLELADLVTEMTKVKHPFDDGQKGQRGIEW